jgi:hypothetical protein
MPGARIACLRLGGGLMRCNSRIAVGALAALAGLFTLLCPAWGEGLDRPSAHAAAPDSQWQFNFTPYGWATSVDGNATVRGHTVDINESFIDIVEKSDSILAWMSYFEARKGRFSLFTDVIWEDLTFDAQRQSEFHRTASGTPFARFPNVIVTADANLDLKARAEVEYESTIIQSGAGFEVANWSNSDSRTAVDVLGGARYWNQELDASFHVSGDLTLDVTAEATFDPREVLQTALQNRGLKLNRRGARLLQRLIDRRFGPGGERTISRTVRIEVERALALAGSGDLEWVDPFVGARVRHQFGNNKEVTLEGDVGGFGVGSDFSWQVVATYGFDVNCFGTPLHTVVGYRALAVDYTESGPFGDNGVDFIQHGPLMGVSLRW